MVTVRKHSCFRYIIAFLINIFCRSAFGAIAHPAERFKVVTVRFYNIAVIEKVTGWLGHHFLTCVR